MSRPDGFSDEAWEVVQRKPQARVLDPTAANRHLWGKQKFRDDVIFTDKETRLRIPPDLISTWVDLPHHFPLDYFHCIIFDPPHQTVGLDNRCRWCDPTESKGISFYGGFVNNRQMYGELIRGQEALAKLAPRMCFKWYSDVYGNRVDSILSLFSAWKPVFILKSEKRHMKSGGSTYWVKLVRRV